MPRIKNAMRHSFITYRFKVIKNMDQVADEAGRDYRTCRRYKEMKLPDGTPVDEQMTKEWFAIVPIT